jgi:hypothetical protein
MEALNGEGSQHWRKAMNFEFQYLQDNKIWILIPLPHDRKPLNCKWIFKIKYNVNGYVARHMVHLVARGFT